MICPHEHWNIVKTMWNEKIQISEEEGKNIKRDELKVERAYANWKWFSTLSSIMIFISILNSHQLPAPLRTVEKYWNYSKILWKLIPNSYSHFHPSKMLTKYSQEFYEIKINAVAGCWVAWVFPILTFDIYSIIILIKQQCWEWE